MVLAHQWVDLDQDQEGLILEWVRWVAQVLWVEWEGPLEDQWVAPLAQWEVPEKE